MDEAERTDKEEDKKYGDKRGDELPQDLHSKQKLKEKIKQVLKQMNDEKERINLTDNEAKFVRGNDKIDLNYNCQTAISEDGIIVSAYTTNCSSDRTATITSVNNAEQTSKQIYTEILADSGYASFDNYEELHYRNKTIYIPDQQLNDEAEKEKNPYHRNHFIYNNNKDCFICPEGKELAFYSNNIHKKNKTANQGIQM